MIPYTFYPLIIFFLFMGIMVVLIAGLKAYHRKKKKRSPFTGNFLRSPGQSLFDRLQDLDTDLNTWLVYFLVMPLAFYSLVISDLYFGNRAFSLSSAIIYLVAAIGLTVFGIFKLVSLFNQRKKMKLGYEGEVAVGQALNHMMRDGYHVYHDLVADKFNIDHIVIGPGGVFAVETKARSKSTSGNGSINSRVIYDGTSLQFPKWKDTTTLPQAERQAKWLSQWLSSATGENTQVIPVVIVPGWFIDRKSRNGVRVLNEKEITSFSKSLNSNKLDQRRIKSIVHQIDQKCRDIAPSPADGLGGNQMPEKKAA